MTEKLIGAIKAVSAYTSLNEQGIVLTSVSTLDFGSFFLVEGVRRAYRRVYVVDYRKDQPYVVEVLNGLCADANPFLIEYAIAQRKLDEV